MHTHNICTTGLTKIMFPMSGDSVGIIHVIPVKVVFADKSSIMGCV